ncbi:hypothetical protein N7535_000654 [Penicillium sp. DV-2018c]|nr:hypothetical protein N7461_006094 [Penicillium sp. DV-2018c]KAJ5582034.1 hypothetical protein N7535_000654 [Penicillium sp. DV-2018c]
MAFKFADPSDLELIVVEGPNAVNEETNMVSFHVDQGKMMANSGYFRTQLSSRQERPGHPARHESMILQLDTINSMEILLSVIHGQGINPNSVSVLEIWHTIDACKRYSVNPRTLGSWFASWIDGINRSRPELWGELSFVRQLLFPSYFFDHAEVFQLVSKRLVYASPDQIIELAPKRLPSFDAMHTPADVMQQLNAAGQQLRVTLDRLLFQHVNSMIDRARCDCTPLTVYAYLRQLHQIGIKPLDGDIHEKPVDDVLARLRCFREFNMRMVHMLGRYCPVCSVSWQRVVDTARQHTENYFEGLSMTYLAASVMARQAGSFDMRQNIYSGGGNALSVSHFPNLRFNLPALISSTKLMTDSPILEPMADNENTGYVSLVPDSADIGSFFLSVSPEKPQFSIQMKHIVTNKCNVRFHHQGLRIERSHVRRSPLSLAQSLASPRVQERRMATNYLKVGFLAWEQELIGQFGGLSGHSKARDITTSGNT